MRIWLLDGSKNFLETGKPSYESEKLLQEARIHAETVEHIHISRVTRWQQTLRIKDVPLDRYPDLVLPRNMDLNTAIRPLPILKILEEHGSVCMNSREGMGRTSSKIVMGKWLNKANMPYPQTIDFVHKIDPEEIGARLKWPFFLKQAKGAEGSGVAYCRKAEEFNAAKEKFLARDPSNPLLAQKAVDTSLGKDVRVFVIGERVVATMLRRAGHPDEARSNYSLGGKVEAFDLPEHGKKLAIKATKALKLDYSGVDLLFSPNGRFIVCEVNRTPDWSAMEEELPSPYNIARPLIEHGMRLVRHAR